MSSQHAHDRIERVRVEMTPDPIDVAKLHDEVADPAAGATLSFVGTVRNEKTNRTVTHIDYQAYESMAERRLQIIGQDMVQRWPLRRVVVVHRVGRLFVGDASIAIVLSTPHRAEGFDALRFAIESVKKDVPIWKKEHFEDGAVWVQEGS